MAFDLLKSKSLWISIIFYFFVALLIASVFSYAVLMLKVYFQDKKISEIDIKINAYGTAEQKLNEKEILNYKKKIDDFTSILNSHRISSNIFIYIEENTLPNVWFSNFAVSESKSKLRLTGEAENMETFSSQVHIFENDKGNIKSIDVLNSKISSSGKTNFTIELSLEPKLFDYTSNPLSIITNPSDRSLQREDYLSD